MTPTRWLLTALSFLLAIGASVWLVWHSWPAQGGTLGLPWWVHGLSIAIMLAEAAMRSVKLMWAGRALGAPVSFGTGLRTVLGGDFAAAITPSRSGSEPARFMVLTAARVPTTSIILLLFVELFMEGLSIAIVAVALTVMFHGEGRAISGILVLAAGYGATVVAVGVVGAMLARRYASGPAPEWARGIGLNTLRWRAVQRSLHQLQLGMDALRHARAVPLTGALAVSVLHVVLRLCALPALVLPLAPDAPLAPLLLWPLVLFYGSVVTPVPGGGGAVELAFTTVLKGAIPAAMMGRALVWWRVYTFYGYVILGALATGRTALRALRGVENIETAGEERKIRLRWRGRRR